MTNDRTAAPAGRLYSISEAAELLGLSPITLRHQAQRGKLPAHRLGKSVWVVTEEALALYREHSLGRAGGRGVPRIRSGRIG